MIAATLAKLLIEASIFTWLRSPLFTPLKRTAVLLAGDLADLATPALLRFALRVVFLTTGFSVVGLAARSRFGAERP